MENVEFDKYVDNNEEIRTNVDFYKFKPKVARRCPVIST